MKYVTDYSVMMAQTLFDLWKQMDEYLLVKYIDGNVKGETEPGKFKDNGKGSDSFRKGTGLTAIEERTVLTDGKCIFPAQTDGFSVVNIFSLKEENV